jgi:hypothetical protein
MKAAEIFLSRRISVNVAKLLVLVFDANGPSNRILYSILDLNDDPKYTRMEICWTGGRRVGERR